MGPTTGHAKGSVISFTLDHSDTCRVQISSAEGRRYERIIGWALVVVEVDGEDFWADPFPVIIKDGWPQTTFDLSGHDWELQWAPQ